MIIVPASGNNDYDDGLCRLRIVTWVHLKTVTIKYIIRY